MFFMLATHLSRYDIPYRKKIYYRNYYWKKMFDQRIWDRKKHKSLQITVLYKFEKTV